MKTTVKLILLIVLMAIPILGFSQNRPNVLFIAVDDLKPLIGVYGEEQMQTPQIDRLASGGMIFTNSHCQQAVCGPSRASLLTGMRPDYTKVWDLKTRMRDMVPDILTIPQHFRNNGYSTVAIGKIFDPRCVDNDYDGPSWTIPYKESSRYNYPSEYGEPALSYYALPDAKERVKELQKEARERGEPNISEYIRSKFKPSVELADVPDEAYMDGQIANNGIKYMEELAASGQPFFLAVGFKRPHLPFAAPKKYWDMYSRENIELAEFRQPVENGVELAYHNYGELQSYTDIPELSSFSDIFSNQLPENKQKELIHGYYASVSFIDAQIGKLLDRLEQLGLEKNTVIILWGDHGWHLGDHALWCKHSNFEQATRSPLIISYPGGKRGNYSNPVEFIDIFPTLCELTGIDIPGQLQGVSLVPGMKDTELKVKPFAVSQFGRGTTNGYSIRTERHRLTLWLKNNYRTDMPFAEDMIAGGEIYDYKNDPNETVNLFNSEKHARLKERMMKQFSRFVASQNLILNNETSGQKKKKDRELQLSTSDAAASIGLHDFQSVWKTFSRNGAIAEFEMSNGRLVTTVKKTGSNLYDTGFQTRKGISLKKGDIMKLGIKALGGNIRIVIGPVGDSRFIKNFEGGISFTEKEYLFTIPEDGDWPVKFQFTSAGLYEIDSLNISSVKNE